MHLTTVNLVEDMFPSEALRQPIHATIEMAADYDKPGKLNQYVHICEHAS